MSHEPYVQAAPPPFLLLTCEHGGRSVPPEFGPQFRHAEAALDSHRGYDIGALGVAHGMAARLSAPIVFSTVTRLLVDLNRSPDQPDLFSEFTRDLPSQARTRILNAYYKPHRSSVEQIVSLAAEAGRTVVHIGVHSCTDRLHERNRDLDIALLFDESRERESRFCAAWREQMYSLNPGLRYPFNEPYRGSDDGLTTTLRQRFDARIYLGIEIELRQGIIREAHQQQAAGDLLAASLASMLAVAGSR